MKRRDFLKVAPAASLAFTMNGLPISTYAEHPLLALLAKQTAATGRVMVLIQLNGGNDGLNMVIPLDKYSELSNARSNILIPQNAVLALNDTTLTGLHPAMTGIRDMYNNGWANITQGVSYPNPNFSHFRATDIWMSGSDSNQYVDSGWLGRYLDNKYPNFPNGYPNSTMPDPLAIQIGSGVSTVVQGSNVSLGMAISSVSSFYNIINNYVDPAPATQAGHELTFIRYVIQQTQTYNAVIQNAANKATNVSTLYPTGNSLADQLKIVARLVAGGLQTPVYIVSMGSFDTHSAQTDSTDHTIGSHANLLKQLSDAVYAFYDDLTKLGYFQYVAAMTVSEFGRRIASNASGGTDHGSAAPVMVFGSEVNPGLLGSNPVLPANATVNDNVPMQNDYRQIYAAVLADWFQLPQTDVDSILMKNYTALPIFKNPNNIKNTVTGGSNEILDQNYPNPFIDNTTIRFNSDGGDVSIKIYDATGRLVRTIADKQFDKGPHEITITRDGMTPGIYFCRLINGRNKSTKQMTVAN
ncbi:MAG: DUF1501 domain-containing protein [Bacteroidetes bacterium]|nr:DUF1501 domain-containing protein [Bacteroidota bacterium]